MTTCTGSAAFNVTGGPMTAPVAVHLTCGVSGPVGVTESTDVSVPFWTASTPAPRRSGRRLDRADRHRARSGRRTRRHHLRMDVDRRLVEQPVDRHPDIHLYRPGTFTVAVAIADGNLPASTRSRSASPADTVMRSQEHSLAPSASAPRRGDPRRLRRPAGEPGSSSGPTPPDDLGSVSVSCTSGDRPAGVGRVPTSPAPGSTGRKPRRLEQHHSQRRGGRPPGGDGLLQRADRVRYRGTARGLSGVVDVQRGGRRDHAGGRPPHLSRDAHRTAPAAAGRPDSAGRSSRAGARAAGARCARAAKPTDLASGSRSPGLRRSSTAIGVSAGRAWSSRRISNRLT